MDQLIFRLFSKNIQSIKLISLWSGHKLISTSSSLGYETDLNALTSLSCVNKWETNQPWESPELIHEFRRLLIFCKRCSLDLLWVSFFYDWNKRHAFCAKEESSICFLCYSPKQKAWPQDSCLLHQRPYSNMDCSHFYPRVEVWKCEI